MVNYHLIFLAGYTYKLGIYLHKMIFCSQNHFKKFTNISICVHLWLQKAIKGTSLTLGGN